MNAAQIAVRVKPRAAQDRIIGWQEDTLLMRVAAPPVEDAANKRVIALLARTCGVPRSRVVIVSGQTASLKRIRIEGRTDEEVRRLLGAVSGEEA